MSEKARACIMPFKDLTFAPRFEFGDMAQVTEVTGTSLGSRLGSGFGHFENAEIPWTVQYDEVLLVLEGQLKVRLKDSDMSAGPRDCVWLPKGTSVTYIAEDALVFYAIEPANWAQEDKT